MCQIYQVILVNRPWLDKRAPKSDGFALSLWNQCYDTYNNPCPFAWSQCFDTAISHIVFRSCTQQPWCICSQYCDTSNSLWLPGMWTFYVPGHYGHISCCPCSPCSSDWAPVTPLSTSLCNWDIYAQYIFWLHTVAAGPMLEHLQWALSVWVATEATLHKTPLSHSKPKLCPPQMDRWHRWHCDVTQHVRGDVTTMSFGNYSVPRCLLQVFPVNY